MKCIPIFSEYIYEFEFPLHFKYVDEWKELILSGELDNIKNKESYEKKNYTPPIYYSSPSLHKVKTFDPITEFMKECIKKTMDDMGFIPNFSVTSMWATKQFKDGFHKYHTHGNTFLAAVYYLYCKEKNAFGTTFYNLDNPRNTVISPARNNKESKLIGKYTTEFVPGKVCVFLGSIPHSASRNNDSERIIIGINTMPVGLTNHDQFDRYYYPELDIS